MSDLQKLLTSAFGYQMSDIYTAIPGVVVTVRNNFQDLYIDVQPSVNDLQEDGTVTERPVILNVPVQMPSSSTSAITFPVHVGDPVFLIFSMRGLDTWKRSNGRPTTPSDLRKFDKRDCIAIPGVMPIGNSTNNPAKHVYSHDPQDLTIVHNLGSAQEVEFRLKTDGRVLVNTINDVEVNCKSMTVNATQDISMICTNFSVQASNISMYSDNAATWTGSINQVGDYSQTGTYTLSGINMNTHIHNGDSGGVTGGPHN